MYRIDIVSQLEASHLEQLPELVDAATAADGHEPLGEHKFLRMRRGDDLAAAVLAFDGPRLAGYAHTVTYGDDAARRASCEFVVHPSFRRRGIGRLLLSHAIMHAQSQAAGRLDLWAYNDSAASGRIATQFGFSPARQLLHLHRHVRALPAVATPAGRTLRAFRPGADEPAWLALNNRIFGGHPENGTWTLEDLRARMAQPWFDAADVLMLDVDGQLAGFCWLKVEDRRADGRVGEVYVIGAAPEYRGRGLGRYLLAAGMRHLACRRADVAAIYVEQSNAAAVNLYASTGFHHHHVDVCYARPLAAAEGLSADALAA
ncbi:MAG: mycothiol synthase [Dehalococcoidia bacterium]|nr:MAG: mycothiol synthase [Dehalococcoidia bacterium]